MTEAESLDYLTGVLRRVFERNDIVAESSMKAKDVFGWDSFKMVEILIEIQEELGIEFTSQETNVIPDVGRLALMTRSHVNNKS